MTFIYRELRAQYVSRYPNATLSQCSILPCPDSKDCVSSQRRAGSRLSPDPAKFLLTNQRYELNVIQPDLFVNMILFLLLSHKMAVFYKLKLKFHYTRITLHDFVSSKIIDYAFWLSTLHFPHYNSLSSLSDSETK